MSLGHRRLAIIDTSAAGHQPMSAAGGMIQIVYNGELYNFREQRAALEAKGRTFRTRSDTEVVLALYEQHGEEFLARLRGIFSLALYDRARRAGTRKADAGARPFRHQAAALCRDRRRPRVRFRAESNAGERADRARHRCGGAAAIAQPRFGHQPRTLLSNVRALPSAHYLTVDRAGIKLHRYWCYETDRVPGLRARPYPEQVEQFAEVIGQSVIGQTIGDVPVGAFLSGGVDSSLIAALMAREASSQVNTFSVGFEDDADAVDESHEAAEIAAVLGTRHHRVLVGAAEVEAHLGHFVRGLDQPCVDGLNSYFVLYAAAQAATVALSGTGGDEVFLGYPWFAEIGREFGTGPLTAARRTGWVGKLLGRKAWRPAAAEDAAGASLRDAFGRLYHCFGPGPAQ